MGIRARGANALMALGFNTGGAYGAVPASGFFLVPYSAEAIGDEQGLIASDLLGQGREPQAPSDDVINNAGDISVPVDLRNFGFWLKGLLGAPTTTQGVAATGSYVFSAQPLTNAIVTVNGTAITFKTSGATGNQVNIGATLADTITALVQFLNTSADANITPASYSADVALTTVLITHDTIGTAGNSFTIVAGSSPATNAVASGATLAGGATTGPYNHVFKSGALALTDAACEIGMADASQFFMNYGLLVDAMKIAVQRSGLLSAVISTIAQGELPPTATTGAGTPTTLATLRFSQFSSALRDRGVPLGSVQTANFAYMNNLDKDESIRSDGRIGGADPGNIGLTLDMTVRFGNTPLYNIGVNKTPIDIQLGWKLGVGQTLNFELHQVRLPKSKLPVSGPAGVMATFKGIGFKDPTLARSLTVTLVNDVTTYA